MQPVLSGRGRGVRGGLTPARGRAARGAGGGGIARGAGAAGGRGAPPAPAPGNVNDELAQLMARRGRGRV